MAFRPDDNLASSDAATSVLAAPSEVLFAAWETLAMFFVISLAPFAASEALRAISFVVAACSSTALAIVFWMSLIRVMIF